MAARVEIADFEAVTVDIASAGYRKYLGDEWKTKERQLNTLQAGMASAVDGTEDIDIFDLLIADKKRLDGIVTVCSSFAKGSGTEFVAAFKEAHRQRSM